MRSVVHRKLPEPERKIVLYNCSDSSESDEDTVNQVVCEVSEELKEEIKKFKRKKRKFRRTEKELRKTIKYYQKKSSEARFENENLNTINASLISELSCKGKDCDCGIKNHFILDALNAELKARITELEAQKGPEGDRCNCNLKVEEEIIKKEIEYFESDMSSGNLKDDKNLCTFLGLCNQILL